MSSTEGMLRPQVRDLCYISYIMSYVDLKYIQMDDIKNSLGSDSTEITFHDREPDKSFMNWSVDTAYLSVFKCLSQTRLLAQRMYIQYELS
jgi:hypothetical protein